ANYHSQVKATEEELQKTFPYAEELREKSERLAQLNTELTMQERNQSPVQEPQQPASDEPEIENKFDPSSEEAAQMLERSFTVKPSPEIAEAVNFRGVPEQNDRIHFGIPTAKGLSEQTIRDMKLIDGNPTIYMSPRTDGQQYKGEILHVDKEHGYCVQLSGKHSLFVHSLDKLERTPEVGENLKLSYPHEEGQKATLAIQETQTRTRSRK
ncbi:MAG: hypothetical protein IJQ75_01245, partial [Synergistaceae bacterium]|nr:hypothetical protein [Synergistaceae bacterium]